MTQRQEARQADAAARMEAQNCFDKPMVLEAGAGTGKTTTIVGRMAYLIQKRKKILQ